MQRYNVVRLMGGLGNQMFEYALGRRLTQTTGTEVRFDVNSGFRNDPYGRAMALHAFNTVVSPAGPQDIPASLNWKNPWRRLAKAGWLALPRRLRRVVYERTPFWFDDTVLVKRDRPAYYFGYWQNEGYFLPVADELRKEFTLRPPCREPVNTLRKEMESCRAVSIHVRCYRELNAKGNKARDIHGTCPVNFFRQAIETIGPKPGTVAYVFSDDPDWTKNHLKLTVPCRFAADVFAFSDVEELVLMAACQHHIISNSTFSWWGAWLGGNPDKIVVAPRIWMRGLPESAVDICPKSWVKL